MNSTSIIKINCPNCGKIAKRTYLIDKNMIETNCQVCDYLLVHSLDTVKVIETYAPGISSSCHY